jgi:hypothetical protein
MQWAAQFFLVSIPVSQRFQKLRQGQGLFEFFQIDFIHSDVTSLFRAT